MLYLTGGITNPFSILLIVPAIVSSTFLNLKSTINLSIFTIIILFIFSCQNEPITCDVLIYNGTVYYGTGEPPYLGSVGITEQFANIYTNESPGGWNIIGNTPKKVFDKLNTESPALIKPGDKIIFYQITKEEYLKFNV